MSVDNNNQSLKHGNNVRSHGLSPTQIVEILNHLDEPNAIIYETNRISPQGEALPNAVAVLVNYKNNSSEGAAVIEFENPRRQETIGKNTVTPISIQLLLFLSRTLLEMVKSLIMLTNCCQIQIIDGLI